MTSSDEQLRRQLPEPQAEGLIVVVFSDVVERAVFLAFEDRLDQVEAAEMLDPVRHQADREALELPAVVGREVAPGSDRLDQGGALGVGDDDALAGLIDDLEEAVDLLEVQRPASLLDL